MARLGVAAHECLIVEDNEHGIRAARASGAFVLEVGTVDDVNYRAIATRIADCNARNTKRTGYGEVAA